MFLCLFVFRARSVDWRRVHVMSRMLRTHCTCSPDAVRLYRHRFDDVLSSILAHTFCTFIPDVSGVAKWQRDVTSVAVVCSASLTKPKSCHCFARARFTLEEERFAKSCGRGTRAWVGLLHDDDRIEDAATKNIRFEHVEDAHSGTTSFSVVPLCAPLQQPCAFHSFNTQDTELQEYYSIKEYTKQS